MCEQTESANSVRDAARCLSQACNQRSLRQLYNDTVQEGVPDWAKEMLKRMK